MKFVVRADRESQDELLSRPNSKSIQWVWVDHAVGFADHPDATLYFDLQDDNFDLENYRSIKDKPIVVNAIAETLAYFMGCTNIVRINGWPGFLSRKILELASENEIARGEIQKIFGQLGWDYRFVPDIPGLVSARMIAGIINEAYLAWEEGVSSRAEIDEAMKTGTSYPFGPFEWGSKIGIRKIHHLLEILSKENPRYGVAAALEKEALMTI